MKFRNPWIDPRILQVRPEDAQAYLLSLGFRPYPSTVDWLLLFDGPGQGEDNPLVAVPRRVREGAELERMIELVANLARWQDRYAGDVLTDILTHAAPHAANGAAHPATEEATSAR